VEISMTVRDDNPAPPMTAVSISPDEPSGSLAEVQLLNDDHTPMDFVVDVLECVLGRDREIAERIMLDVHHMGRATCGIYPTDIAEAKVAEVLERAHSHRHPLQCVLRRSTSAGS